MANDLTLQVLHDGDRNAVVKLVIEGDASGDESATTIVDISNDLVMGPRSEVKVQRVTSILGGFTANLLWDADADVAMLALPADSFDACFRDIGGLRNNAGDGKTGDIKLTTVGLGAEVGTILLHLAKVEGASPIGG